MISGRDGEARAGLNLAVWEVQPTGQYEAGNPRARSRDEYGEAPVDDELRL
jgi:hypothetical protein